MRDSPSVFFLVFRLFGILAILLVFATSLNNLLFHRHETPFSIFRGFKNLSELDQGPSEPNAQTGETAASLARIKPGSRAVISTTLSNQTESRAWLKNLENHWEVLLYTLDDETANLTTATKSGNSTIKSLAFLSFIVDNWDNLPEYMLFVSGKRYDKFNDHPMFDILSPIQLLKFDYLTELKYLSLRCRHWPRCPASLYPDSGHIDVGNEHRGLFAELYKHLRGSANVPDYVGSPGHDQFAVSRDGVQSNDKALYEKIVSWISDQVDQGVSDMRIDGVMEDMWHIIFGRPANDCSFHVQRCYCRKFGLCALKCPSRMACEKMFWPLPWQTDLPEGWPDVGQGEDAGYGATFPVDGWWKGGPDAMNGIARPPPLALAIPPDEESTPDDAT